MKFFEYISSMKESGSPFAIAGVVIVALFLIFIIFKMLGGMRRGTWRQLIRTGMTLLSAIASYIVASWLSNHIIGSLDNVSLEGLIVKIEAILPEVANVIRSALEGFDPEVFEYIILLPAALIIIPILTTVIFLLINLVLKIVRAIIIKIIGFKKAKNNSQRLGGALLSALEGMIWIAMVILPICAILSLADSAMLSAIENEPEGESSEISDIYEQYISPFTENPVIGFIGSCGSNAIADGIATVKVNGASTNLRNEVLSVAKVIIVDIANLKGCDFTALKDNDKQAISSILDSLADSPFVSNILVKLIHTVPGIYESGLIPTEAIEGYKDVADNLIGFLKTISYDNLKEDLDTICDFYFGFSDSGIISAIKNGDDIMAFISDDYNGDKHLLGMINTLSGNPRTKVIVDGLYNLVLNAAFAGGIGNGEGEDGGETAIQIEIQDVKDGLNNIVSVNRSDFTGENAEEEYREALSSTIDTTINDVIGVDLEDEVVDEIATFVDENFSEQLEELTDEEFNELLFEVVDIYQGFLAGEEINPDDLNNLIPGGAN